MREKYTKEKTCNATHFLSSFTVAFETIGFSTSFLISDCLISNVQDFISEVDFSWIIGLEVTPDNWAAEENSFAFSGTADAFSEAVSYSKAII